VNEECIHRVNRSLESLISRRHRQRFIEHMSESFPDRKAQPDCEYPVKIHPFPRTRTQSRHSALGTRDSLRYNTPVKPGIIVVEDDPDISRLVRHHLENEGFSVRVYPSGTNVLADAERQRPALFVLDIMVPGKDGLEICRTIRQTTGLASVPVIFLTAKSSEADRVLGLELGADDYIAKPFSPRELVARVKAVLRRFERPLPPSPIKVGEIEIDPSAMTLTVSGKTVATTATEFRLLDYFARHKGRVFSRDHLLDSVWRDTAYVTPRSVDVYVRRIREKIEPDPENPRYLKTVRGAGYRFESPK
jgi:DNA-binding response OmpR family regulator